MDKSGHKLHRVARWVSMVAFSVVAVGLLGASTAHADSFDFTIPALSGGTGSYPGGVTPFNISNTSITSVTDTSTSASVALGGSCGSACLDITTGNAVGFTPGPPATMSYGGNSAPGSINILGTAPSAGITTPTGLFSGMVTGAEVVNGTGGIAVDISTVINQINPTLLAFFTGNSSGNLFNGTLNLSLALTSGSVSPSGFTADTRSGNLNDTPTPEPGSLAMVVLGLGLVGFAIKRRGTLGDNLAA